MKYSQNIRVHDKYWKWTVHMCFVGRVRKVIILLLFIGIQSIENQCVLQYRFHAPICFGLVSFKNMFCWIAVSLFPQSEWIYVCGLCQCTASKWSWSDTSHYWSVFCSVIFQSNGQYAIFSHPRAVVTHTLHFLIDLSKDLINMVYHMTVRSMPAYFPSFLLREVVAQN